MTNSKPNVGEVIGEMTFQSLANGTVSIGQPKDRWTMLFVYRGKHCPRCKRFLNKLNAVLGDWTCSLSQAHSVSAQMVQ